MPTPASATATAVRRFMIHPRLRRPDPPGWSGRLATPAGQHCRRPQFVPSTLLDSTPRGSRHDGVAGNTGPRCVVTESTMQTFLLTFLQIFLYVLLARALL